MKNAKAVLDAAQDKLPFARAAVLRIIRSRESGATLYEISVALGWPINRVSGRVTELAKDSLIYDSGYRRMNPLSGKPNTIWAQSKAPIPIEKSYTNTRTFGREEEMNSLGAQVARISPNSLIKMYGWQAKRLWESYYLYRSLCK